uniref:Immunoglobulin superfamily member 10-like n=1 Tax=Sinocyclocheilus anshuiensis TaxID=1608454 RepID=A0A671LPL4_9TELE
MGKFEVLKNGTLFIQKANIKDQGQYICFAQNEYATVRLQVVAAPPAILEEKRQLVRAEIGQNLFLACSTYGDPRPTTYWVLHDGTIVQPLTYSHTKVSVFGNGTLYLRDVQITESGKYECIATSSTGSERRVVTLSVKRTETAPQITETSQQRTDVIYGGHLHLNCSAVGDPKPQIIWRLPSKALVDQSHRYTITKDNVFFLIFKRYTLFNNGTLYLNKVGGNVRFDCKAIGEPKPKVFWMLPSKDMIAASNERYLVHANGSLDVRNVKLADAGEYVCMALNAAGEENKVYKLDIDGNPPIINAMHTILLSFEIMCDTEHFSH